MRCPSPPIASERAAEMYVNEELDGQGEPQYLDKVASVSGLVRVRVKLPLPVVRFQSNSSEGGPHGS